MTIKAIRTTYKGIEFRSRTEARWAVFFDELGVRWDYEHEGYELESGWYVPDFWLPDHKIFFEVKPPDDKGGWERCLELASVTGRPVCMSRGAPAGVVEGDKRHGSDERWLVFDCQVAVGPRADDDGDQVMYQTTAAWHEIGDDDWDGVSRFWPLPMEWASAKPTIRHEWVSAVCGADSWNPFIGDSIRDAIAAARSYSFWEPK